MSTQNEPALTDEQIHTYRSEGYLLHNEPVFAPEKFARLKAHFDQKLENLDPSVRPEAMDVPHFTDPSLFEWVFSDEVLRLVEPLIGPDIALWSTHFICKPKGDGRRVPWHEDSAYWAGQMDPMNVVTVWLALDPSSPENGCMYVVPRTHDNGFSDYEDVDVRRNVFPTEITNKERFERLAVPCTLAPNEASLHDGKLIHGSPPNTSSIRRCGYTMRFTPSSVRFNQERLAGVHQVYLARGRDLGGNTYADPSLAYPELARFRENSGRKFH
jgi:Phytanoyl-CoA dioxygenase (PhyH)